MIKLALFLVFWVQVCLNTAAYAEEAFPFIGISKSANVNVRAGQSQNFETLAEINAGAEVVVVDKNYSWYKIKLPRNARSYVFGQYLESLGDNIGRITGDNVNIRARESAQSSVIGRLPRGDLVKIVKESNGWIQIEPVEQSYGWVSQDYIVFKSRDIPPPRIIEPPLRNVYKRKQLEARTEVQEYPVVNAVVLKPEAKTAQQPARVVSSGIVAGLQAQSVTENIRHQLVIDGNSAYYLKGYRTMLDGFLNYNVRIEGDVLPDIKAPHPVVLVTKIQLML